MLSTHYRKAEEKDVRLSNSGPSALFSRFLVSFAFLGCGVFGFVYLLARSLLAAGFVSGILLAASAYSILSHHRRIKKLERRLGEPEPIEVVEVRASRVFDLEASTGPALCFELSNGQMLLLFGQWLFEHELYRAPRPIGDGNQERFNLADDPFGFPSEHFALHRWRGEVRPFWIQALGAYMAPEVLPVRLPTRAKIQDVEVFAGTFSSLQKDIEYAFG